MVFDAADANQFLKFNFMFAHDDFEWTSRHDSLEVAISTLVISYLLSPLSAGR